MRVRSFVLPALFLVLATSVFAQSSELPRLLMLDEQAAIVENLEAINSESLEGAPQLLDNGRMLFTSKRSGKDVLYITDGSGSSAPTVFMELGGKEQINSAVPSTFGITVVSCSDRKDGYFKTADIYTASLIDGKIEGLTNLGRKFNSEFWDSQPTISPDGETILFASDRKGGRGGTDIYISTRSADGHWSEPAIAEFSTNEDDLAPTFSPDGKLVFFSMERRGGRGGLDIYAVERTGQNAWSEPQNLGAAINSKENDLFLTYNATGDVAYFASDRRGGKGSADIYKLTIKPVVEPPKMATLQLKLIDANTGNPISARPDVTLTLADGQTLANEGIGDQFAATMLAGSQYRIAVGADGYVGGTASGAAPMKSGPFVQEVRLVPAKARIVGHVTNVFSHKPVQATLTFENLSTGAKSNVRVDAQTGAYSIAVNPATQYRISTEVTDYDAYTTNIEVPTAREEMITVEKEIRLQPAAIDAVMLYFDFNKSNLKKDEITKMERFIHQVKENPYVRIEVNGHTDDVGTDEYNEKLSERRAVTVEDYLLSRGVPREQLAVVKGFGKAAPLVPGTSDDARAKNRRVEVRIVGMDK